MSSRELDNLVKSGMLKAEPGDQKEFDGLIDSGRKRLADARKSGLATESQFDLAYNAAHAFSLGATRWHGYRPRKRFLVFQCLIHTVGLEAEIWRVLDKCHRVRNSIEYEGYSEIDKQLLADLLNAAEIVRKAVEKLGPVPTTKGKGK
jgi:hypothetical protein